MICQKTPWSSQAEARFSARLLARNSQTGGKLQVYQAGVASCGEPSHEGYWHVGHAHAKKSKRRQQRAR